MKELDKLVVFSIFMENGQGIAVKAPGYIMEKWRLVNADVSDEFILDKLDDMNQAKYRKWQQTWKMTTTPDGR